MVVIRLAPHGKKGDTVYKITVCNKGAKLTGRYIEKLGIYKPSESREIFELDAARYEYWLKKGAQPSPRVTKLLWTHKEALAQTAAVTPAPAAEAKPEAKAAPAKKAAAPAKKAAATPAKKAKA